MKQLPDYKNCANKVLNGTANPIESFIYDNEPTGEKEEKIFREGLLTLINYIFNKLYI